MSTFTVEHVDLATGRTFEDATEVFLGHVPLADPMEIAKLQSQADVETMMKRAGALGILVMTKLHQGPVVSLLGPTLKLSTYLIGSPLLGAKLFVRHRSAGLYAPAHVTLYEAEDGTAHFAYDKPSSFLAQFDDKEIAPIAKAFDEKLATLGKLLTR